VVQSGSPGKGGGREFLIRAIGRSWNKGIEGLFGDRKNTATSKEKQELSD
jgi:hypothetical protein